MISATSAARRGNGLAGAGAVSAAAVAWAAAGHFRRRIGGHTGDCLGAVQQLTELAFLVAGLAVIHPASDRIKEIAWRSI